MLTPLIAMKVKSESGSLLRIENPLVKTPTVVGANLTVNVFFSPGLIVPVAEPLSENGDAGAIMVAINKSASPVFEISTSFGAVDVPKSTSPGFTSRFATGAAVPLPVRFTVTSGVAGSLL